MKKEEIEKLLIVVDMVNGFVKFGNMADIKINSIVPEVVRLVQEFKKQNAVAFVRESHKMNATEFNKFLEHCIENTLESELINELKEYETDSLVYLKNSTSAMFAPHFMEDIKQMVNLKEVVIVGCCTDICVMNLAIPLINYFDQLNRNVKVIVPRNAVSTYGLPERKEIEEQAFNFMKTNGIEVVDNYQRRREL